MQDLIYKLSKENPLWSPERIRDTLVLLQYDPSCDDTIGADYVISQKPNPAVFAESQWQPEKARADIRQVLEKARGRCHIEFIMKDISTVRYEPQRLWEWARIAMEEVEELR